MPQLVTNQKLYNQIEKLQDEVRNLRSLVIGQAGRDPEGSYRPEFIKEVLRASKDKPKHRYAGRGSLLRLLRKSK